MKEIVEIVGSDQDLFRHAEQKMKLMISEIYLMKKQNDLNQSKRSIDENSE